MKCAGYRFQSASLNSALNYAADVFWFHSDGGWYWDTARTPEAGEALRRLGMAATRAEFELVVARCARRSAPPLPSASGACADNEADRAADTHPRRVHAPQPDRALALAFATGPGSYPTWLTILDLPQASCADLRVRGW